MLKRNLGLKAKMLGLRRIRKSKQERVKLITSCEIRSDGIIQCPTRTCSGYGFDNYEKE